MQQLVKVCFLSSLKTFTSNSSVIIIFDFCSYIRLIMVRMSLSSIIKAGQYKLQSYNATCLASFFSLRVFYSLTGLYSCATQWVISTFSAPLLLKAVPNNTPRLWVSKLPHVINIIIRGLCTNFCMTQTFFNNAVSRKLSRNRSRNQR